MSSIKWVCCIEFITASIYGCTKYLVISFISTVRKALQKWLVIRQLDFFLQPLFLYLAHQAAHAGNGYQPLQAPKEYIDRFPYILDPKRRTFAGKHCPQSDNLVASVCLWMPFKCTVLELNSALSCFFNVNLCNNLTDNEFRSVISFKVILINENIWSELEQTQVLIDLTKHYLAHSKNWNR